MNGMYVLLSNEFNSFNCNAFFKVLTSMLTINTERNKKNQNEHQHYLIQFLDNNLISVLIVMYMLIVTYVRKHIKTAQVCVTMLNE